MNGPLCAWILLMGCSLTAFLCVAPGTPSALAFGLLVGLFVGGVVVGFAFCEDERQKKARAAERGEGDSETDNDPIYESDMP